MERERQSEKTDRLEVRGRREREKKKKRKLQNCHKWRTDGWEDKNGGVTRMTLPPDQSGCVQCVQGEGRFKPQCHWAVELRNQGKFRT